MNILVVIAAAALFIAYIVLTYVMDRKRKAMVAAMKADEAEDEKEEHGKPEDVSPATDEQKSFVKVKFAGKTLAGNVINRNGNKVAVEVMRQDGTTLRVVRKAHQVRGL